MHKIQYVLYAMYEPSIQWQLQAIVAHGLPFVGFMDGGFMHISCQKYNSQVTESDQDLFKI
jgi:hypothetical protein